MATQQELIEKIKQRIIRLYEDSWLVSLIQKALDLANGDIDKAIDIAYDELDLNQWSGWLSSDAGRISLTGKSNGFVAYWSVDSPNKLGEPDIKLNNRQVFMLVRDGSLPTQETLF